MEIVIKIPDRIVKMIKGGHYLGSIDRDVIHKAIAEGISLPKGHGRIADIDKLLEEMRATSTYDIPFALERVKSIIEADKENEV